MPILLFSLLGIFIAAGLAFTRNVTAAEYSPRILDEYTPQDGYANDAYVDFNTSPIVDGNLQLFNFMDLSSVTSWANQASNNSNVSAFCALIRNVEADGEYNIINGGDHFSDYSEHPFIINPNRVKFGTSTASGAYQMIKATWIMARDGAGLSDFSPASQDAACIWILKNKRGVKRAYPYIVDGDFLNAIKYTGSEWEAFSKIAGGGYYVSMTQAKQLVNDYGGDFV